MTNDTLGIATGNAPPHLPSTRLVDTCDLWSGLSRCTPSQQSWKTSWKVRLAVGAQTGQLPSALRPVSPPGPAHQNWPGAPDGVATCRLASPAIIRKPCGNGTVFVGSASREP